MNFDFEFCERKRRLLVSGHLNFLKDEWKLGKWEQGGALCRFNRKSKFKFKVGFGICFEFKFCIFWSKQAMDVSMSTTVFTKLRVTWYM